MLDPARLSPHSRRILREAAAVSAGQVAAANRTRAQVRKWFDGMLARHPFLAWPTMVGAPPLIGEGRRLHLTVLTMPANLAGLPALALPVPGGPRRAARLGAAASGRPGSEEQLIWLGRIIEAALRSRPTARD